MRFSLKRTVYLFSFVAFIVTCLLVLSNKIRIPIVQTKIYQTKNIRSSSHNQQKSSSETKDIAILGTIKELRGWLELADLHKCFLEGGTIHGDNETWICRQVCAKEGIYINLYLTPHMQGVAGKEAVVYGLSPFALVHQDNFLEDLLTYDPAPGQLMVMYCMESPLTIHKWINTFGQTRFHVDMTYSYNSLISLPYGYYKPFKNAKESGTTSLIHNKNWASNKTGFIAWMGSNCNREVKKWPRMDYINHLQIHANIDMYGRCGTLTCLPRLSNNCTKLMSKYKFYLAFENSECLDYSTEKFWVNSLMNDVVPVVYGAPKSNYLKHAPPGSFIHIGDFKSPKELAEYLHMLDKNDDLYNEFFKWKSKSDILVNYPNIQPKHFCDILHYLKPKNFPKELKAVSNSKWFNSCRHPLKEEVINRKEISRFKEWRPWIEE